MPVDDTDNVVTAMNATYVGTEDGVDSKRTRSAGTNDTFDM
jgi:hypothetical protein